MKRRIALLSAFVVISVFCSLAATACGGLQPEEEQVKDPLGEITQPIDKAQDVKQQVEQVQQQRNPQNQ